MNKARAIDYLVARWRIGDHGAFMVLCTCGVTEVSSLLFVVNVFVVDFIGGQVHGVDEVAAMLGGIVMFVLPAAIVGPLIGALPGMIGGFILMEWADFRAPSTFEILAVAAVVAGAAGLFFPIGPIDPLRGWYPLVLACIAVLSVLILAPVARKRRIVVLVDA